MVKVGKYTIHGSYGFHCWETSGHSEKKAVFISVEVGKHILWMLFWGGAWWSLWGWWFDVFLSVIYLWFADRNIWESMNTAVMLQTKLWRESWQWGWSPLGLQLLWRWWWWGWRWRWWWWWWMMDDGWWMMDDDGWWRMSIDEVSSNMRPYFGKVAAYGCLRNLWISQKKHDSDDLQSCLVPFLLINRKTSCGSNLKLKLIHPKLGRSLVNPSQYVSIDLLRCSLKEPQQTKNQPYTLNRCLQEDPFLFGNAYFQMLC